MALLLTRTAQQHEADARRIWDQLKSIDKVVAHPSSNTRSILIAASNALAEAVVALLAEADVKAEVVQARHVAGLPEGTRCLPVRVDHGEGTMLAAIVPCDPALRCYPGEATDADALGDPAQVKTVTPDSDGWVSAAAIAEQLTTPLT